MSLEFQPSPAELGNFKTAWTNSYNGQKAFFLNNSVLIYGVGSIIKFFNVDTKEIRTFTPPHILADNTNGYCLLTANSAISKFAFSETQLSMPTVYVYDYPSRQEICKLTQGALVEYLAIEFSNSEAILTLSGIPNLEAIVWNWKTAEKITSIKLNTSIVPKYTSFSSINWRNIAIAYDNEIKFYNLEQFDSQTVKVLPSRIAMPTIDDSLEVGILPDFKDEFAYPTNAITSLDDESGELIDENLDKRERHKFKCLCWISVDEILIVTKQNSFYRYRLNDSSMRLVYKPDLVAQSDVDNHEFKIDFTYEINHLKFHRQGVFAVCSDGMIRLIDGSQLVPKKGSVPSTSIHVKKAINASSKFISNISFNSRYSLLSISTEKGVFVLEHDKYLPLDEKKEALHLDQIEKNNLIVNYDHGMTVSVSSVSISKNPSYYVLKDTGCLQIWNVKIGQITNRIYLNEPCSNMAIHPKYPLAAIGTVSGRIIFVDLTDENAPKIIENCRIHRKQIRHLRFNSSGTLLFSVGEDNKLFVIDTRLNEKTEKLLINLDQRLATNYPKINKFEIGFYLLGYIEFEGEAVAIDTIDFLEDEKSKNVISRVALAIHDKASWDVVRKNIQEIMPSILSPNSPAISETISLKSSNSSASLTAFNTSIAQNILFQCAQMETVIDRSAYTFNSKDINYDINSTKENVKLACKVIVFDLNFNIFSDKNKIYATRRLDFKDDIIMKSTFYSHFLFSDLVLAGRSSLVCSTDRFLTKFNIPEYEANKKASKVVYLELNEIVGMQDLGYSCLSRSLNNQFIAVGGYDGSISVRKTSDLRCYIDTKVSHFSNGGVEKVRFTHDGSSIIVLNHENTLMNINWICNNDLTLKMIRYPLFAENSNPSVLKDLVSYIKTQPENEMTWFSIKEIEYFKEQDAQYLPIRKEILDGLTEIKLKLQELMAVNSSRDDLSKLKEHEFYLDLDELERLHKETDAEINKIRDKIELDNLAKLYVRDVIKKDCWDNMIVKGRGIQAFNTNLLVENYSLKERTRNELNLLDRIKTIRRIEINAQKTRNEVAGELMRKDNVIDLIEMDEEEMRDSETVPNNSNPNVVNTYLQPNLSILAFKGSIGSLFNGDSNLFYNQFELYNREQKWIQIILIQDAIYRIKDNFNKEFEQIMQRKNHEIAKIREKNQRLKQIYVDLSEDKQLPEPQFGDNENPETLFDVKDEEIKVEKYLTPEQRKLLEEQEIELAKRRELEKLDNWRERGLLDMMGGVLQIRREDELKKEIPPPPFIEKPQDEWTADEVKQFQAYEQKIKELNEEREKLKKHLNAEINKINEQILECYQNFDSQLLSLHLRKVKTQQAIYQEELKILRLANSLIIDTELETYENQMAQKLETIKEEKKDLGQELQDLKKVIETSREEFEIMSAEDKSQEKAFAREFSDVPPAIRDQLLRLFKRRAKPRMQISKTNANPPNVYIPELGSDNPFSDRPTTAQQLNVYDMDTEMTLAELDDYDNNSPGGVDRLVWDRFTYARRQKIAMENNLRVKGLNLNDMNLYMQKRMEEDEHKRKEIDELTKNITTLQEIRLKAYHNMQVQLLMKQGQVEIDAGPYVHNFDSCLLIHRNVVESLNKIIQAHGKQKISIMVDCKDYKKGIRQLEWEHRKMSMTIEDYIQKQRDITYLRLSREVQDYLNYEDYDAKKQKEIAVLEQTLAYQTKQFEKVYGLKAKKLKDINKQAVKVANTNYHLDEELLDKNVTLYERKHINEEMTGKTAEAMREERFQQIIQRRKLVDLAKAQAQEVAFLRSEVERLRMKTFPALVQIEF